MVFLKFSHLQVASAREPLLALLHCQSCHQSQTRLAIGEDPYHPRPALYLLVETFEAVGGADTPTMTFRESQAGQTLLDVLLKVLGHLLVALLAPLLSNRRRDPEGLFPARGAEDRPKVRRVPCALLRLPYRADSSHSGPGTSDEMLPGSDAL